MSRFGIPSLLIVSAACALAAPGAAVAQQHHGAGWDRLHGERPHHRHMQRPRDTRLFPGPGIVGPVAPASQQIVVVRGPARPAFVQPPVRAAVGIQRPPASPPLIYRIERASETGASEEGRSSRRERRAAGRSAADDALMPRVIVLRVP
jgi:hypothetical protein